MRPRVKTNVSILTKAGRYELREELGRGAMGVVYHAHDPVIGRDVAVKTMHLSEAGTGMSREELVARFQTEARAAGLLTHPNIVVIYDAGEEEGLFYITMELVEGRSLQTLLDAHQLFPLSRVMKLMEQVCSALDFAHQHNVVHRDIKPANLVLTADDTVKITDFGTAKILQFGTAQTAHVMGTPSYMSPEQVKGKPVDGRSDIFSLGVILYELMTGEKPFPGQNITTVIYKIINEEPISPRSLDSSIHPGLSAVITRALSKDPDVRFQNCHELLNALKNYHELAGPEQTIRMVSSNQAPAPSPLRANASTARDASPLQLARPNEAVTHTVVDNAVLREEESSKQRGTILLSLFLLAVIGFAGYRIYPPMVDLWQRAHESQAPSKPPVGAISPVSNPGQVPAPVSIAPEPMKPESKSDVASPPAQPNSTPTPVAEKNSASPQVMTAAPSADAVPKSPEPVAAPPAEIPARNAEKAIAPPKQAAPASVSAAIGFESKLQSQLADLPLASKLKTQVTSNSLTLSGQLTFAEHQELLNHLHNVPSGVRVIDDVETDASANNAAASTSAGWVWVRSQPRGARIVIDNAETGLRTPARVEIPQGEHTLQVKMRGFSSPERTIQLEGGQTMQFTETLTPQ
jgi:serine/threonine-protein kinase